MIVKTAIKSMTSGRLINVEIMKVSSWRKLLKMRDHQVAYITGFKPTIKYAWVHRHEIIEY